MVPLFKLHKEFLRVAPGLGARAASDVLLDEFPLFAVGLEGLEESEVLVNGPAACLLALGGESGTGID